MGTAPENFDAPPVGTKLRGGYELCRYLGGGGMGAVYEALGPDGQRVAVKLLHQRIAQSAAAQQFLERFKREASVTSTLVNAHIVSALDSGVDETLGAPYMVLPLLVGQDLEELVNRLGPLQPGVAVRIFLQACEALQIAHSAGVVHRDIKPANIFLDQDESGNVTVRVLDFGVAKMATEDKQLTRTGSLLGTPLYMSPEQLKSVKTVDARTDIWSLGIALYQSLAGTVPFQRARNLGELYVKIATEDVDHIQDLAPWIEPGLAQVVHGTLLRDASLRCPSAEELAQALRPFSLGSEAVHASMFSPLEPELRESQAPRSDRPRSWSEVPRETPANAELAITVSDADPWLGQTIGGRYQVLRCLGQGGMGAVYEATGPDGNRYAVKVIDPDRAGKDASVRRRFVREARAVMAIQSPHVVRVLEAGEDEARNTPFMVMELLHGMDLGLILQRQGAMDPSSVTRLFLQACRGIAAAHQLGFVHRDIKPSNLFLQQLPSGDVVVKICDFGIVKRMMTPEQEKETAHLTRTGGVVGSPIYMSPEQAKTEKNIDLRTDVWSLGISLFEALSGRSPWSSKESVGQIIVAICTEPIPHLQDWAPWVPKELAEAVHRALQRDPAVRFGSMQEFAAALAPFSGGTEAVRPEDLLPVPQTVRERVAERASMPHDVVPPHLVAGGTSSLGAGNVAHTVEELPHRRGPTIAAVGAAVLVLGVGAGAFVWQAQSTDLGAAAVPTMGPDDPGATTEPAAAERVQVVVTVKPTTATVEVDGKPRDLNDGKLELEGEVGDTFAVSVTDGDAPALEKTVFITKDGKPEPDVIDATAMASAEPSVKPATPGGGPATRPVARPTKPAAPSTAKPASSPKPKPAPKPATPSKPAFADDGDW